MSKIDYKRLPKDGRRFEALVCELLRAMGFPIIEEPAIGADGGRDILIERVTRDAIGERRERIVVQCKHFAHTGRAVSERDLGVWTNALLRNGAQGYLLVVSTAVTENVSRVFAEFSRNKDPQYAVIWPGEKLEILLNEHVTVRDTFFPPEFQQGEEGYLGRFGWGLVFPAGIDPEPIKSALAPLRNRRKSQIKLSQGMGTYREFFGNDGVQLGESHIDWLTRNGVGPGAPNPSRVPRFLLLIGSPNQISFEFQELLQVQYFVGRLSFETHSDYSRYAVAVCESESKPAAMNRKITFFAPESDPALELTSKELVSEIIAGLSQRKDGWLFRLIRGVDATKKCFAEIVGSDDDSAIVFSATHGVGFRSGHHKQIKFQGALITHDWPGRGTPAAQEHYFSAVDVLPGSVLTGKIIFLFGCYCAGTDCIDEYSNVATGQVRRVSEQSFIAALANRLLEAGALALIGPVSNAWQVSFLWRGTGPQPHTFMAVLESLMTGESVGVAVQVISKKFAELAAIVSSLQANSHRPASVSSDELNELKMAMLDAKQYLVLGDPYGALKLR